MVRTIRERETFMPAGGRLAEIVVVDPTCDRYGDFVRAARDGAVGLHLCVDGRSAMRLARRFGADAWIVAAELPDMSGYDLIEMLDRPGIFVVADAYRPEDEQRALAAGVAGYLVGPTTLECVLESRRNGGVRQRIRGAGAVRVPPG